MTLQRFEPFRELMNIQERMNRLFGDLGAQAPVESEWATATWAPAVDIYETPQKIVLNADLPGIKQEDIQVSVERDRLVLRGERKFESEVNRENYHRVERSFGTFARSFTLPPNIDQENIRADYKNGVLQVTLPKRDIVQTKQINIKVE